jgi:hypothetical protein
MCHIGSLGPPPFNEAEILQHHLEPLPAVEVPHRLELKGVENAAHGNMWRSTQLAPLEADHLLGSRHSETKLHVLWRCTEPVAVA